MITTMHSDQNASPPRVEVITSVQRRRRWPDAVEAFKKTFPSHVAEVRSKLAPGTPIEPDAFTINGIVTAVQRSGCVGRLINGHTIRATIAGRLMKHKIRIITGDDVTVEITPYDVTRGRNIIPTSDGF
jgi:translation initiation factor IF-1